MGGVACEQHPLRRYEAACRVMSVNREIQLGLCTPKSVPCAAATSNSRSRRVSLSVVVVAPRSTRPGMAPVLLAIDGTDATTLGADADLRRTRHLDLGDDEAGRRIQSREVDAGGLADHAAAAVAPDEVVRSATCHRPVRRQRRCRPVRGRPPPRPEALGLGARRSTPPGCARSGAARAPARSCGAGKSLTSSWM